jgi:hypothetical protein
MLHSLVPSVPSHASLVMSCRHVCDVRTGSETIYAYSKGHISKFLAASHTISKRDLSISVVMHPLVPSVPSHASLFMSYVHFCDVHTFQTLSTVICSHSNEYLSRFFCDTHTILEVDLSNCAVLHSLLPSAPSRTSLIMRHCHLFISFSLPLSLSFHPSCSSIHPSMHPSMYLSIYLSISLFMYLTFYLSFNLDRQISLCI